VRCHCYRDEAEGCRAALDSQNRERQKIERSIVEEVSGAVREIQPETDFVIVEGNCSGASGWSASLRHACSRNFTAHDHCGGDGDQWRDQDAAFRV
jgi:hypothetical protein